VGSRYGLAKNEAGSAIAAARKPTLDKLFTEHPHVRLAQIVALANYLMSASIGAH